MGGLICLVGSWGLLGGGVGAGSGDIRFWLRLWNFTKKIEIGFGNCYWGYYYKEGSFGI